MDGIGRRQLLLGAAAAAVPGGGWEKAPRHGAAVGWEFPEHRSAARLAADSAHAARQVEALQAPERAGQILDRIQARQQAAPAPHAVPFDRYRPAGSGTEVLVARGQLVVRRDQTGAASPGFDVIRTDRGPAQLAQEAARLREQDVTAAMNVIVPLGHTIKADDHPYPTQGPGPAVPPAAARARVALIDTGIAAGRRGDGWLGDAVVRPGHADPLDVLPAAGRLDWGAGHGTFTAGIVRRVAPRCEIVAYRFTRGDGLGTDVDVAGLLLKAAEEAHRDGIPTVVNASLGTPAADGVPPPAMQAAVEYIGAHYPEVLIVASAGNMGTGEAMYPAALDGVVAVGALTDDLRPAPFSSHGSWLECSTVGVGVVSAFVPGVSPPEPTAGWPDHLFGADAWAMWSGTSFSAPQISGAVARLCGERPGSAPREALDLLLAGRPALPGYGRVLRLLPGTPAS